MYSKNFIQLNKLLISNITVSKPLPTEHFNSLFDTEEP